MSAENRFPNPEVKDPTADIAKFFDDRNPSIAAYLLLCKSDFYDDKSDEYIAYCRGARVAYSALEKYKTVNNDLPNGALPKIPFKAISAYTSDKMRRKIAVNGDISKVWQSEWDKVASNQGFRKRFAETDFSEDVAESSLHQTDAFLGGAAAVTGLFEAYEKIKKNEQQKKWIAGIELELEDELEE
jgi:hypothetical protein